MEDDSTAGKAATSNTEKVDSSLLKNLAVGGPSQAESCNVQVTATDVIQTALQGQMQLHIQAQGDGKTGGQKQPQFEIHVIDSNQKLVDYNLQDHIYVLVDQLQQQIRNAQQHTQEQQGKDEQRTESQMPNEEMVDNEEPAECDHVVLEEQQPESTATTNGMKVTPKVVKPRLVIDWKNPRLCSLIDRFNAKDPSVSTYGKLTDMISLELGEKVSLATVWRQLNKRRGGEQRAGVEHLPTKFRKLIELQDTVTALSKKDTLIEDKVTVTSNLPRCTGGCFCAVCHHAIIYPKNKDNTIPERESIAAEQSTEAEGSNVDVSADRESEPFVVALDEAPVVSTLVDSKRMTQSMLTISVGNRMVRQFRYTNTGRDGRAKYYRCSRCETLNKKHGTNFRPNVKTYNGVVVTNVKQSQHHPDCKPLHENAAKARQIIQEQKRAIRQGELTPKEAWAKGRDLARKQEGLTTSDLVRDDSILAKYPEWKRCRKQYYRQVVAHKKAKTDSPDTTANESQDDTIEEQCVVAYQEI